MLHLFPVVRLKGARAPRIRPFSPLAFYRFFLCQCFVEVASLVVVSMSFQQPMLAPRVTVLLETPSCWAISSRFSMPASRSRRKRLFSR